MSNFIRRAQHITRDILRSSGVALFAATLATSTAFGATDNSSFPAEPPAGPPPSLGDLDGDGLSDALATKIGQRGRGAHFEVIVTFDGPGDPASAQAAVGPFRVIRELGLVRGFLAEMTGGQIEGLARANGVFRIEENVEVTAVLDNTRSDYRTDDARSAGYDGSGIGACIVDTGGDAGHLDIAPQIPADGFCNTLTDGCNVDASGNALPDAPSVVAFDDHSHGTHVGGIVAGAGIGNPDYAGVAPGATLYFAKVLDSDGSGTLADVEKGMNWCAGLPGAHVVNMSVGSSGSSDGNSSLELAADCVVDNTANASCNPSYSGRSPKIVVVAMGNSGPASGTVGIPGAARNAISAGASAPASVWADYDNGSGQVYAPYSSRGPTADGRVKPEIMAPGSGVTAPYAGSINGYITYSGTSMATPYTAGTVVLMLDAKFSAEGRPIGDSLSAADIADIKNALFSTAEDVGPAGQDNESGHGIIDTWRAVSFAAGAAEPDPGLNPFVVSSTSYTETIRDYQDWRQTYTVQPGEAITVSVLNPYECSAWLLGMCFIIEYSDFDARLWDGGTLVDMSQCYDGEPKGNGGIGDTTDPTATYCGASSGYGRQETLHAANTAAAAIDYEVEVFPWNGDAYDSVNQQTVDIVVTITRPGAAAPAPDLTPPTPDPMTWSSVPAATGESTIAMTATTASDPSGGIEYQFTCLSGGANCVTSAWQASASYTATGLDPNTTYTYEVRARDGLGNVTAPSTPPAAATTWSPPNSMHIEDLDGMSTSQGSTWTATVTALVRDSGGAAVSGATVSFSYSGRDVSGIGDCVTGAPGTCSLELIGIRKRTGTVIFTVTNVISPSLTYDPAANADPDGDSNGTAITVSKP
jgi:serine protease AprX